MLDDFDLSSTRGLASSNGWQCKNPQCRAFIAPRAKGSGRQREYCSTSCRRQHSYALRTKRCKRLTCKNCGALIKQPTGRGRHRLWCSVHCRDSHQYRTQRERRLAISKAWREANPERVKAARQGANTRVRSERVPKRRRKFEASPFREVWWFNHGLGQVVMETTGPV
jgi:hypothetical protein